MKEAVIRMETAARPTTDRSASPRLLKGLLLAITLVALLATTVILCQQDIENPSYVYMILDETGMQIIDGRPDGDRTTGLLDIRADNSSRDAQLLLVKGQQVQVADAQGATYLVTTRRETVDNLLRRSGRHRGRRRDGRGGHHPARRLPSPLWQSIPRPVTSPSPPLTKQSVW